MKISKQSFLDRPPKRQFFCSGPRAATASVTLNLSMVWTFLSVVRRFWNGIPDTSGTFREVESDGLGWVHEFEVQRADRSLSTSILISYTIQLPMKNAAVGFGAPARCANRGFGRGHGHYGIIQACFGTTELNGWGFRGSIVSTGPNDWRNASKWVSLWLPFLRVALMSTQRGRLQSLSAIACHVPKIKRNEE